VTFDDYDADDRDAPQEFDLDFDEDEYVDCPYCAHSVYADAPRCPACNHWLEDESLARSRSRGWRWPMMIAFLVAIILVLWHGLGR